MKLTDFGIGAADMTARLVLQPIYRARTGEMSGYEMLCRTPKEQVGGVQGYILGLEKSGKIETFDGNILRRGLAVAQQIADFLPRQMKPIDLHINLSGYSLAQPGFTAILEKSVASLPQHGVRVVAEITETARGTDEGRFRHNVDVLHRAGVGIVLDDFPQGHNSQQRLLMYAGFIHGIKLDKSVIDTAVRTDDFQQVRDYVRFAHDRQMTVVAEGVSSPTLLNKLHHHGVDYGQGFGLGKPHLATDLLLYMNRFRKSGALAVTPPPPEIGATKRIALATAMAFVPTLKK
jgi:EAL domain-containing protein (putative c-di-GMP-specific phosphodiesterase class I)